MAAPGTQALIQWLPRLVPARRVGVLGFSYGEHARSWAIAGASVSSVDRFDAAADLDVIVVVNPNNPDGRLVAPDRLREVAATLARRGGLLVVDEAFMDALAAEHSLAPHMPARTVVLRSFGKFYGLAGLRLGFAVASEDLAATIRTALGPWAVAGPAIAVGSTALRDHAWAARTRASLHESGARLDGLLKTGRCAAVARTPLFRLVRSDCAARLFDHLARAGILVRPFKDRPDWLGFGLCGPEEDWARLAAALSGPW